MGFKVLLMVIIARIVLRIDKRIIGFRFFIGSLGLPGFGRGINCLIVLSLIILVHGLFLLFCLLFQLCVHRL